MSSENFLKISKITIELLKYIQKMYNIGRKEKKRELKIYNYTLMGY